MCPADPASQTPSQHPAELSAASYASLAADTVTRVAAAQAQAVGQAARLLADSVEAGGVMQAFGSGHSEAFAMEIAGRAGGLVPTNRMALRDAGLRRRSRADPRPRQLERDPSLAQHIYDLALGAKPQDVFLIASNSGGNGASSRWRAWSSSAGTR